MIYWIGNKYQSTFLFNSVMAENVLVEDGNYCTLGAEERYTGIEKSIFFTKRIAFIRKKYIDFFELEYGNHLFLVKKSRERIYTEQDDIHSLPKKVILKTRDLDFIRNVFTTGRKVSWYDPDWSENHANFLKFNFDRLFINPFKPERFIIFPIGEVSRTGKLLGEYNFDSYYGGIKYGRLLGYSEKSLVRNFNRRKFILDKLRMTGSVDKYDFRCVPLARSKKVGYYNLLSLSYMLCKKSIATTVEKNRALKG